MKLGGSTDEEKVDLLIKYLRGMNDELNIPHCIKNYGADSYPTEEGFVPEEVFLETSAGSSKECHRRCLHRFQSEDPDAGRNGKTPQVLLL